MGDLGHKAPHELRFAGKNVYEYPVSSTQAWRHFQAYSGQLEEDGSGDRGWGRAAVTPTAPTRRVEGETEESGQMTIWTNKRDPRIVYRVTEA